MAPIRNPKGALQKTIAAIFSTVVFLVLGAAVILKIFGPSKLELKRMAAEERRAREESRRAEPAPGPMAVPTVVTPQPAEPPAAPQPAKQPDSPTKKQGEERLGRADRHFAAGEFKAAAAEYREAEFLGAMTDAVRGRKEVATWIVQIVEIRDYFATEERIEPSWVTAGHWNLKHMEPARLPSDAWREQHRKTFARLVELEEGTARPPRQEVEAPAPFLPDRAGFLRSFTLIPHRPDGPRMEGAVVKDLVAGSPLAKAGVRDGDRLVEVNGKPLDTVAAGVDLVNRIERDRGFWGKVVRGGETIPFRVEFPREK